MTSRPPDVSYAHQVNGHLAISGDDPSAIGNNRLVVIIRDNLVIGNLLIIALWSVG